ncbi:MAG: protein kinase [Phycisphaerales bacterium]|nr:protein kinase [Phycisphaerales bacterium]
MSVDPSVEHLYDRYLDAAMAGSAEPPNLFLSREGISDPSLAEALRAVYEEYTKRGAPAPGPDAGPGSAPTATTEPFATGTGDRRAKSSDVMGDFRLIERLGEGGMGVVFLAEQVSLRRQVAVKLLRAEAASSAAAAIRFEREALAAAKLNHPHIVRVIAVGEHRGARYIAMEYVEGRGLDEVLKAAVDQAESISVQRAVRWCAQIARALASAHEHGIIHRDVKPSNIRISTDDRALLLDFGIARELDAAVPTLTETFVGSPFYAAPEQVAAHGGEVDARSDVYSLGLVLYECITGRMPFTGRTLEQVLHAILTVDPPSPRRSDRSIPRDVDTVVMRAIEKTPARRYQSAALLADDLEAILELRPVNARPHGVIERASRWARRRRSLATAIATGMAAILIGGGLATAQAIQNKRQRAIQARALITEGIGLVDKYGSMRETTHAAELNFEILNRNRFAGYHPPAEDAAVDAVHAGILRTRREREEMFYRVLDLASQAERYGIPTDQAELLRARAYLQRYLESEVTDSMDRSMYRDLVLRHDPAGVLADELRGSTTITLECNTPTARIDVFRRVYDSDIRGNGERRLVLVPLRGWPAQTPPGSWGLRISTGAGDLRPEGHIVEICSQPIRGSLFLLSAAGDLPRGARLRAVDDTPLADMYDVSPLLADPPDPQPRRFTFIADGKEVIIAATSLAAAGLQIGNARMLAESGAVPALYWSDGTLRGSNLPAGLSVRTTAAPAIACPESIVTHDQARSLQLEPGNYVVIATAPGMEPQRLILQLSRGSKQTRTLSLHRQGDTPEGFVRIIGAPIGDLTLDPAALTYDDFCIMEREITFREYFEFLNDPQTLHEIAASPTPIRYPHNGEEALGQKDAQGRFLLPQTWEWDWPALHVSWHDAAAYAKWRTARAQAAGQDVTFMLPSLEEWLEAFGTKHATLFVYGDRFNAKWSASCFARPKPWPEPVMSYPIDESPTGVFDISGSVSEWTRSYWQEGQPHYRHSGGSWATGEVIQFMAYGGNGMLPERDIGFVGFRLVMRHGKGIP